MKNYQRLFYINLKSVDGARYRELQLRKKLLLNKGLKDFLEK